MTPPTQAQIARVAAAIDDEKEHGLLAQAKAALTAAAEVGPTMDKLVAAEKELEIQRASQVSAVNQMLAAEQREAATIERCAQVAEAFLPNQRREVEELVRAIAAAIRALKDS